MSDCCNELKAEVAALRAEIAKLKPVNEESIIEKSVERMKLLLPAIVGSVVALQLAPALKDIISVKKVADTALSTANNVGGKLGELAGKVAGIAAAIFALGSTIAILNTLGRRIDSVEASLGFTDAAVSRALGLIQSVKGIATRAEGKADAANQGVADNQNSISRLSGEISETKSLARTALEQANEGIRRADLAKAFANRAAEIANIGVQRGTEALTLARELKPDVDWSVSEISNINAQIPLVQRDIWQAQIDIGGLKNDIAGLDSDINKAIAKATNAEELAKIANGTATTAYQSAKSAQQEAEVANTKAQAAILENAKLRTKINALEQKDIFLEKEIDQAQIEAYAAAQLAGLGISTAQNTAQGLSNLTGRVGIIGGTAINADGKATNALGQISTIKNGVVTNPAIQNAIAQPIGRINDVQQKQQEQIKQIEQKISAPGANTVTRTEFEQIKQKLGEADKMNREGNAKIDEMLAKLPALPAATAAAVAARVPSVPQIKQAVGSAMCESANSGCVAGALNNQASGIKQDLGQKLRDLEQGLNAGANAAQLTLLNTINTKLGDQVVGGIGRVVTKITTNQAVNQIANLVTMAAAIHNVIMLSDGAAQTFFSILDNIFAIPTLIINPEAETISTQQVFGGAIENVMKSVFGVEEWAQIKAQWAIYNRIYQSTANVVNDVRSIGGSIVSAVEQSARLTGKGFNAMQDEGLLSENNWDYTPENLKLKGGLYAKFGKLADGISVVTEGLQAIEAVTSEIRSAVDSANQIKQESKEIEDAIKEAIGQSKTEREAAIEALPPKEYSWEDLI